MSHFHAVVWIDHREARVFHINEADAEKQVVRSHAPDRQLHHHHGSVSGKRAKVNDAFLHEVVEALKGAKEWLILGPGSAKLELVKHIQRHDAKLADRVVGVESADHPSDGQITAHARDYFAAYDRTIPQR